MSINEPKFRRINHQEKLGNHQLNKWATVLTNTLNKWPTEIVPDKNVEKRRQHDVTNDANQHTHTPLTTTKKKTPPHPSNQQGGSIEIKRTPYRQHVLRSKRWCWFNPHWQTICPCPVFAAAALLAGRFVASFHPRFALQRVHLVIESYRNLTREPPKKKKKLKCSYFFPSCYDYGYLLYNLCDCNSCLLVSTRGWRTRADTRHTSWGSLFTMGVIS